jgi:hypothetical protein
MPNNDLTRDSYNPPGTNSADWETFKFDDLEDMDLFWLNSDTRNGAINIAHRKLSVNTAMNLQTRETLTFDKTFIVYQKI